MEAARNRGRSRALRGVQAFWAVEVLVGALLLAMGVIPVVGLAMGTGREAGFTEAHLLSYARAEAILDAEESLGWGRLAKVGEEESQREIPARAGPPPALPGAPGGDLYRESLTAIRLSDGLVALTAEVAFTFVGETRVAPKRHTARALRFVARPDQSWIEHVPLPLAAVPVAD